MSEKLVRARILKAGDTMNSQEMYGYHDYDRPGCPLAKPGKHYFQIGPSGYRCVECGWQLVIEENDE